MLRRIVICACVSVFFGCVKTNDTPDKTADAGAAQHDASAGTGKDAGQLTTPADAGHNTTVKPKPDAAVEADAGSADDAGTTHVPAVNDPAPTRTAPGEYNCSGCPSSTDFTSFTPDYGTATSHAFTGTITGATGNGTFYVANAAGQSFSGPVATNAGSGAYNVTLPLLCGDQTIKLVWQNTQGTYVVVLGATTGGCVNADIRATLTWDNLGLDFELHLIRQGGHINDNANDCTWTSCIGSSPDWGVTGDATDNPHKDVDNTGNYGPENIFYPKPAAGKYTVMVEHWGGGGALASGSVILNVVGKSAVVVPINHLASHWVFTAATIDWPSGVVTPVETQYDCTASWSGGCTAAIP